MPTPTGAVGAGLTGLLVAAVAGLGLDVLARRRRMTPAALAAGAQARGLRPPRTLLAAR